MTRLARISLTVCSVLALFACGGNGSGDDGDDAGTIDGNGTGGPDADPWAIDAMGTGSDAGPGGCVSGGPQCNDCVDNDGDGNIDGFDVECTGSEDNDESSFETGIPGDNMDTINQDCFFDGDSGAGNDRCNRHVCCILNLNADQCDAAFGDNNFDPATDCEPPSDDCIARCDALTPPGCDCFGCCTICDADGCVDIAVNPTTAPNCDEDSIHDPVACPVCVKVDECGSGCSAEECILCPGQDPSDLPDTCNTAACPEGQTVCTDNSQCASNEFCSAGCCIGIVN
jgi:hypothetical protein